MTELFSYSVGIGAIIGLIRCKTLPQAYLPFILLLWLGFLNEIVTTIIINEGYSNAINNNIYVLAESFLILWLFKNWALFNNNIKSLVAILFMYIIAWLCVNFIFFSIKSFSSYFNILYSLTTVLMSIHMINRLILEEKRKLIKSSIFLVAIGFIVFYTYNSLVEIFWVYGLNASKDFRIDVYRIMTYINLIVNLIYAIAVLWIPKKREYTLL